VTVPTVDAASTQDGSSTSNVTRTADGRLRAPAAGSAPPPDPNAPTTTVLAGGETGVPSTTATTAPLYTAENNWGAGGPPTTPPVYNAENNWGAG